MSLEWCGSRAYCQLKWACWFQQFSHASNPAEIVGLFYHIRSIKFCGWTRHQQLNHLHWPRWQCTHSLPLPPILSPYSNCRSLPPKLGHLRLLASSVNPLIICLCETWLDDSTFSSEMFIPDFTLIHRDHDWNGGGVAVYIHDSTPFSICSKHPNIELLMIDLKLNFTWLWSFL